MTCPPDDAGVVDDPVAFTRIFDAHHRVVHAYFVGRTSDAEAPDLLQETFLRVWRRITEVRGLAPERQRAWIFTVARNLAVDTYRSRSARDAAVLQLTDNASLPTPAGPEELAVAGEYVTALDTAIRDLPEQLRVVVALHALSGVTSSEIGAALDVPAGTVRYRLSEARRRLTHALDRAELDDSEDDVKGSPR